MLNRIKMNEFVFLSHNYAHSVSAKANISSDGRALGISTKIRSEIPGVLGNLIKTSIWRYNSKQGNRMISSYS